MRGSYLVAHYFVEMAISYMSKRLRTVAGVAFSPLSRLGGSEVSGNISGKLGSAVIRKSHKT